jgi:nucleoside-diphosphate-sugar epimerase
MSAVTDVRRGESAAEVAAAAQAVVTEDLALICGALREEFATMSGKALLVTGGAGFLGHYLVQAALHWNREQGPGRSIRLTIFDNFVRGVPDWLTERRGDPNLSVAEHDLAKPLPEPMGDFDYIVHAASIASPTYYRRYPIETMDANTNGLRNLLDYARARQGGPKAVSGLLYLSSSEIYGDPTPENIPTPEDYRGNVSCTGPRACYDEAKRYGETVCATFARHCGLPVKVARPFNNYGPGLKISDRRVIPDFARDILAGRDIVLLSDGSPTRTFCYVADAVVGYYKVLVRGGAGEAYNVGVETPEISMRELAETLVRLARDLFGYRGRVVHAKSADGDYLVDNPNRRCPVIVKARRELGFDPVVGLEEGLRRLLVWYAANREGTDA